MNTTVAESGLYETRRDEIARDFTRYFQDFSNGGWYGGEYRQAGRDKPHLLRDDYHHNDRYFSALFSMAHQLLENAYEDSFAHTYWSMLSLVVPGPEREKNASKWSRLFPEVDQIISAHGPEVKRAFETVFETCRTYQKTVEEIPPGHNGRTITRERNGLTTEQTDRLHDALQVIWQAHPELDPRISEGFDYVMSGPVAKKTFTFSPSIGNVSAYSYGESSSEDRSDYRLPEMLETYDGQALKRLDVWKDSEKISLADVSAIARQTVANLTALQKFAVPIAERALASYVGAVSGDHSKQEASAKQIFDNLASGRSTIEQEAHKISKGKYGGLAGGYTKFLQKDDERLRALAVASHADEFLKFCVDIRSGAWFEQEREKIATLCAQKNLPGWDNNKPAAAAPSPAPV